MKKSVRKIFGFLILPSLILAQDKEVEEKQLDDINATSSKEVSFENKTYISDSEIAYRQVSNLTDLFRNEAGIDVGGGGILAQKVYVRGLEDRLMRVNIDGVAQNGNAFHHQGNLMIDPTMLKSIEVTKGAASASVGPGALAGSISMSTKDASDMLAPDKKFGSRANYSVFSNFGVKKHVAAFGGDHKTFDLLSYFSYQDIFYYRDAHHTFTNFFRPKDEDKVLGSPSMQTTALLKGNFYLTDRDKLTFNYNVLFDYAIRPFRSNITDIDPSQNGGVSFAQQLFKHKNLNNNLSLTYERKGTTEFNDPKIKATAYGNIRNMHLTPHSIIGKPDDESNAPRNILLNNLGLDLNITHALNQNTRNAFEYGLNYQNMSVMDFKAPVTQQQRGREDSHIIGAYAQANYYILDNLSLGAGSRYDSYFYYDKNYQNHHTFGFSPSGVILYSPIDSMDIKLSYAYVTRGALPGDALLLRDDDMVVNPNLKAEKAQNLELDMDYEGEHFAIRSAVFYKNIKDFINSYGKPNKGTPIVRDNLDSVIEVYGLEAGADYFIGGFLASFNFSRSLPMVHGRLLADTYELGASVGNTYIIKLAYDFKEYGFNISWVSKIVQRLKYEGYDIYNDEIATIDKAGYDIHSIYMSYVPRKYKNLFFALAVENLFNKYYVNQASPFKVEADASASAAINRFPRALPEPGLNVKFSFAYKF